MRVVAHGSVGAPGGAAVPQHALRDQLLGPLPVRALCLLAPVNGGVKPRINGEQRVAEATTCRVERQRIASRQAALRLLRCAPAPRVTRRNPLTQVALMAGSRLPAVNDPLCENTAIQKVNPHILCSPLFGAFGSPSTAPRAPRCRVDVRPGADGLAGDAGQSPEALRGAVRADGRCDPRASEPGGAAPCRRDQLARPGASRGRPVEPGLAVDLGQQRRGLLPYRPLAQRRGGPQAVRRGPPLHRSSSATATAPTRGWCAFSGGW